jgi:hypothetical protein
MAAQSFAVYLEERLSVVDELVSRVLAHEEGCHELRNLRAYLINLVELIDRNPGVDAAADDLYDAARTYLEHHRRANVQTDPRRERHLTQSLDRLRYRLTSASPSDKAHSMGLRS